ncbi:MAG: 30S ribosomal protein S15 [Patescibacteria group bacterium]
MLTSRKKQNVIKEVARHKTDTGSAEVQVSLLSKQISELATHLKKNSKDNHSRRGLLQMVGKRRRLLKYLSQTDEKKYKAIIKKLEL